MTNNDNKKNLGFQAVVSIVAICFIICLVAVILSNRTPTLTGFLEYFSNCPSINVRFIFKDLTIHVSWGIFDGFRDFLNVIITPFSFILFLTGNLVNVILFVFYLLRFLI